MKLVRQRRLFLYRGGAAHKVYEIDLCEMGDDAYVVNYRYGRVGEPLKEGTKTIDPVTLAKAERLAEQLERKRLEQGYVPEGEDPAELDLEGEEANAVDWAERLGAVPSGDEGSAEETILARLEHPTRGRPWSLARVAWRAGELRLRAAAPRLLAMLGRGQGLRDYCVIWALGRCAAPGDSATLRRLGSLIEAEGVAPFIQRIAAEATRALLEGSGRERFIQGQIDLLPDALREAARVGPAERFAEALEAFLDTDSPSTYRTLHRLYLIDSPFVRPALLEQLRVMPFAPGSFMAARHLFKAAEFRLDAEVFGLLAYRIERTAPFVGDVKNGRYMRLRGRWQWLNRDQVREEFSREDAGLAFSKRTRDYLRRRIWRTLRRAAEDGRAEDYARLAVGVLLPYTDRDAQPVRRRRYWRRTLEWDAFAPYLALGHILYRNSPRYRLPSGTLVWRCRDGVSAGAPPPSEREEGYLEHWDAMPPALLHLLDESRCRPVHVFAARALQANTAFCEQLGAPAITMLLLAPYDVTVRLGVELAERIYDPSAPDVDLVCALLDAPVTAARRLAIGWINDQPDRFRGELRVLFALLTSQNPDVSRAFDAMMRAPLDPTDEVALLRLAIDFLLQLTPDFEAVAASIVASIQDHLRGGLERLELADVLTLLDAPLASVQALAGEIALAQSQLGATAHEDLIAKLLGSEHDAVRAVGVRLFSALPDALLIEREGLIVAFCSSPSAELRDAARPLVQRLSGAFPDFGARLLEALVSALLEDALPELADAFIVDLITEDLEGVLDRLPPERVWALIQSEGSAARELGGLLLASHLPPESLSVAQIAELTHNEILSIREAAFAMMRADIARIRGALEDALRVLTSPWADARQFGFDFFGGPDFDENDFSPALLVSICDSVREDVQQFGRRLITRFFDEADGPTYLLTLSEHPSSAMQAFASSYLERFAGGHPARIEAMELYFASVLIRINEGRVARARALTFLGAEAARSEEAARIIARILGPISATCAIGARAEIIEALVTIAERYPDIDIPLTLQPVAQRSGA